MFPIAPQHGFLLRPQGRGIWDSYRCCQPPRSRDCCFTARGVTLIARASRVGDKLDEAAVGIAEMDVLTVAPERPRRLKRSALDPQFVALKMGDSPSSSLTLSCGKSTSAASRLPRMCASEKSCLISVVKRR